MLRAAFAVFLATLIATPLMFGTVEQWSLSLMQGAAMAGLLFWLLWLSRGLSKGRERPVFAVPGLLPLTLLLAYAAFQLIPLPASVVKALSPHTFALYSMAYGPQGPPPQWMSISVNTRETLLYFFKLASYAAFYVLTVQLLARKAFLKQTVSVLAAFAALLSLFAILQHFLSNGKIYWLRELTFGGTPFGPYVNRNHYAGLMEMLLPVVLGLFLHLRPHTTYTSLRKRLADILNQGRTNSHVLAGLSVLLIASSVFLTQSRGGIISISVSMLFFLFLYAKKGGTPRSAAAAASVLILTVLALSWLGWGPLLDRFEATPVSMQEIAQNKRLTIISDSIGAAGDFSLTGAGLGTFADVYPAYASLPASVDVHHAHNDYVQLLLEGGIVSVVLALWFVVAVLTRSFMAFARRHENYSICIFVGSVTGILAILIHSLVDFNLQLGAGGLYFFFLCGLAVSAANTRLRGGDVRTHLDKVRLRGASLTAALVAAVLLATFAANTSVLFAQSNYKYSGGNEALWHMPEDLLVQKADAARLSARLDPLRAAYPFKLANIEAALTHPKSALRLYGKAAALNPTNGEYLQALGLALSLQDKDAKAADALIRAGVRLDVMDPARVSALAAWLLSNGKTAEGLQTVSEGIALEPENTRRYITLMLINNIPEPVIRSVLPGSAEPHIIYGLHLMESHRNEEAHQVFLRALELSGPKDNTLPHSFNRLFNHFRSKGYLVEALATMDKAVKTQPKDLGLRLAAGRAYEEAGLPFKAVEQYKVALVLDPGNKTARQRLHALR